MSTTREARAVFHHDVVVAGGGLIGLACASAIAREGLRVAVVTSADQGAASPASAGILAPSVGKATEAARALAIMARDLYPEFLEALAERTGLHVPLALSGILEIARGETEASLLRASLRSGSEWIDVTDLRQLEPLVVPGVGGAFHPVDGAVDAPALLAALTADAHRDPRMSLLDGRVIGIDATRRPLVAELEGGGHVEADCVVVAAGAWAGSIRGLPRPLPVTPVRGQMLAFDGPRMRHVVMGSNGYVVQRGNRSLVGSTMEQVGFDAGTTAEGADLLQGLAIELSRSFAHRRVLAHWAGLRPMTPDLLPIIGADPDCGRLFYACGHSKNGVLLAPLTAQIIAELVARGRTSIDATPYAPGRSFNIDR
ncbi:MAG TPA: FAD-dependent oxidoreductase [Gemmatimonadaceae bacterium]|nr:FAD-dependent oxidoreductase [Gemmatimonadaceae bacterium]